MLSSGYSFSRLETKTEPAKEKINPEFGGILPSISAISAQGLKLRKFHHTLGLILKIDSERLLRIELSQLSRTMHAIVEFAGWELYVT
jgi:hypothetical protein